MRALSSPIRRQLEAAVLAARRASESASRAALEGLGVFADRRPEHLDNEQAALRNGLRAKQRQLGGDRELLVAECAYEQWHRLLFARFLADSHLLLHPQYRAPVTLEECDELATDLGEPDGWSVAARFAAEILPGIFRLDDPCVRLRLAPEGRDALERIIAGLPAEVFAADDALGWVYQFWQRDKKDEVNASERKIGGADVGPVTQLFTENYMVRFLLENSLGAWWTSRHPTSPLTKGFDYLRFNDEAKPAAGSFGGWPDRAAELTLMDPCCGSGHFLVEAFSMLWKMRAEDEGLRAVEAQDAILRENLFGLELDTRCVQIAMFAVALQAWKTGGGWRQLPVPNIACSGIAVKAPVDEWKTLAGGDERLEDALVRLHILFRDADTLGSLIDPRRATEIADPTALQRSTQDVDWEEVAPLLDAAVRREATDPAALVLGADANGVVRAAHLLTRRYTLVVTNPPFLAIGRMDSRLRDFVSSRHSSAKHDLATTMFHKHINGNSAVSTAMVLPENWLHTSRYEPMRRWLLSERELPILAWLGSRAFETDAIGSRVRVVLIAANRHLLADNREIAMLDAASAGGRAETATALVTASVARRPQAAQLSNPDARVISGEVGSGALLSSFAESRYGLRTGDSARLIRKFWELDQLGARWRFHQSTVSVTMPYGGREDVLDWDDGQGGLHELAAVGIAALQGQEAWGRKGVAVSLTGEIRSTLYEGTSFDNNCAVVWAKDDDLLPALWAFCSSPAFHASVRAIDDSLKVMNATLLKVPFDIDHWREVATSTGSLPEPSSHSPTQWLFTGRPEESTTPLQVAVCRLLGYRWPRQPESDELDTLADADGIVCLPSVAGEPPASERLLQVLSIAFGETWSPTRARELLRQAGSKKQNVADWLRDDFFKHHCAVFGNRPFIWHIWDGQRDGFSALVNVHRLDRKALEKLTYTYLGQDWVERQRAGVRDDVAGAEARLTAAIELQRRLEAILAGEKPLDIYVRWKELADQPIGWEPDLNDGVRLNVRPFVEAEVLRSQFNIHWKKDRGKNPDGSERHNDGHLSLAEKLQARKRVVPA